MPAPSRTKITKESTAINPVVRQPRALASSVSAEQSMMLAATRKFIQEKTGHKQVKEFLGQLPHVNSGSFAIDDLIGGTPTLDGSGRPKCPGYPRRAISEVFGDESSGKTTAALQAIADCQAQGGVAMFLDYEHALDHGYAKAIGVNFAEDRLLIFEPNTFEEGLKMIFAGLKGGVDLIVVDSVAAMLPKSQLEKTLDKDATIGALARAMAQNLPKITVWLNSPEHSSNPKGTALVLINQVRAEVNTGGGGGGGHGTPKNTAGGKALKFFCFLRLSFTRIGSEFVERTDKVTGQKKKYPYGNHTIVKVIKNKMDGKQGHATNIFIRFGQGIDEQYSLISAAISNKLIKKSGTWLELGSERFQGREQLRTHLKSNPQAFDALRGRVLNAIQASAEELAEEVTEEDAIKADFEASFGEEFGDDGDSAAVLDESEDDGGDVGDAIDAGD